MRIYEIDEAITSLIDPETGEIMDYDAFAQLQLERSEKIENMALWYKDLTAESKAIREEEKALAERRKSTEIRANRLKEYLDKFLCGENFTTPRAAISFRKSAAVMLDDDFIAWAKDNADDLLRFKEPEADKTLIKDALKSGRAIEHASIVENVNIQIK